MDEITNKSNQKIAYIFSGQGTQFVGMGKELFNNNPRARRIFEQANTLLGFDICKMMFDGSKEDLRQTHVTQPAIFIYTIASVMSTEGLNADMVAGHSLGEFSALVAMDILSFEDGLKLVSQRAQAMQKACEKNLGAMSAIIGLDNSIVEEVCHSIKGEIVVAANYNCPGQLVISGSINGIDMACEKLKKAGCKRILSLTVGGAFHSPLMEPAQEILTKVIESTFFKTPTYPIYQNVNACPSTNVQEIKYNLIAQLTSPVRWTQSIQKMVADGGQTFIECGPGKVLQGLVKKISPQVDVLGLLS